MVQEPVFCVGSPHRTPHIILQHRLEPGAQQLFTPRLEPGRHRLRAHDIRGGYALQVVDNGGACDTTLRITEQGWPSEELALAPAPTIAIENATSAPQQFVLERTAWSDQATTAAEVIALQVFRDLFSNEALRPGERITVGNMTVLFTDLRKSTQLYQEIGDAPAFGLVMNHFDVLKAAIADEGGAIVKTIGDAVMAVFRRPLGALRAALRAQRILANPPQPVRPLLLKVGIHTGPCIAVTLNERLDYFGSTVNIAARLTSLSAGEDIVISDAMNSDPEITEFHQQHSTALQFQSFVTTIRGFEGEEFQLWRIVQ
jgi:class 3 adenylate cyclase